MSWAPKRFWTKASAVAEEGGHAVHLDGRPVRTPAKAPLRLPTRALAERIAAEWDAQEGEVRPHTMPATRMANSAIDKVGPQRALVIEELARYGGSDLLCYRAEEPDELVARQRAWDPLLDWAAADLGSPLAVTAGVIPVAQPEPSLVRLRDHVAARSDFEIAALHDLVAISGSLVLALAVAARRLDGTTAFDLSRLDETFQAEKWGIDPESAAMEAQKKTGFLEAEAFFLLCR
ncbi:ATP12 family chaperone protein [Falsirhodobacter algicola]|uniref:ATPase n=1 Tax=Falsirhodobacter algicola TaxID=2692330 RepID=A0A8J8MTR9_9RHOB|nr:ATP12 family protein [Falsirhodobacter algicola]QUS36586.1 ATPase [Falsirhodobacter algicola]